MKQDPLDRQILEAALASAYDLTLHAPAPRIPPQVPRARHRARNGSWQARSTYR